MNIRNKIYIIQIFFSLIVLALMSYVYINYEKKHLDNLNNYIETTASSYANETLLSLHLADYLIDTNREFFLRMNTEAKKRIQENSNISLSELKKEFVKKYKLDDIDIEFYMVNKNYIIYDTTYKPDLGFDLSFAEDTVGYIQKCNEHSDEIYFVKGIVYDSIDKQHKIYTFTKIRENTYLEMGFIDKRLNDFYLNEFSAKTGESKHSVQRNIVITLTEFQHYFDLGASNEYETKSNFFEQSKRYDVSKKTDNPIINAVRQRREIRVEKGEFMHVYKPILSHKEIALLRDADVVLEIVIDISEKLQDFERFKLIFVFVAIIIFLSFVFMMVWTKFYITKPTKSILSSMNNLALIDDKTLLSKKDEFGVIANEYNKLIDAIKKETALNKTLLLENKMFIADTVHQIRTPLSVIMMNSDLIKMSQIDNKSEEFIEQIYASINMLTNSYEDLAYITSHDTIEYKRTYVSLSDILQKRVDFFSSVANVNSTSILVMIENSISYSINQIELERLIDNNISNAIKYGKVDEPITVELEKHDDEVKLSFYSYADPIQNIELIFEKSYRENEEKRGLGLGLNMVKNICEKYGVTYEVKYYNNQNIFTYIFKI